MDQYIIPAAESEELGRDKDLIAEEVDEKLELPRPFLSEK